MNLTFFDDRRPRDAARVRRLRAILRVDTQRGLSESGIVQQTVLDDPDIDTTRIEQAGRRPPDGVECFAGLRRIGRDGAQDFRAGGLILERLAQLAQQPCVFDGDDGLTGEGRCEA